ncbi:hypothetical protein LMG26411_08084 [Cupriavidus numazuensis]|uniref:Uncharacterized protein n=1 Tax=Cupriavidus numazuensis TaxID=221992 RepID=A0ABM8TWM1_9BURK|nr:hypothetical protein LMG26411_08084 [Cupriavidus numazuensis]
MPAKWSSPCREPLCEQQLADWRVLETYRGERHFIGTLLGDCRCRVTPGIVRFNAATRTGITAHGNAFTLTGKPGPRYLTVEVVAIYTAFDPYLRETVDVTEEYVRFLQRGTLRAYQHSGLGHVRSYTENYE